MTDTNEKNAETLERVLDKLEKSSDGSDLDLDSIIEEIDFLSENAPIDIPDDLQEQSMKELLEKYPELDKSRKGSGRRISFKRILYTLIAAVAAVVVFGIVAGAVGFEPVVRFIDDLALIVSDPSGELEINEVNEGEYRSLREALDKNGMEDALCITWIPKEYGLSSVSVKNTNTIKRATARYASDDNVISIIIKKYADVGFMGTFENDMNDINNNEAVELNDICFYLSNNVDELSAMAVSSVYEYEIHGSISNAEMIKIIKSMI